MAAPGHLQAEGRRLPRPTAHLSVSPVCRLLVMESQFLQRPQLNKRWTALLISQFRLQNFPAVARWSHSPVDFPLLKRPLEQGENAPSSFCLRSDCSLCPCEYKVIYVHMSDLRGQTLQRDPPGSLSVFGGTSYLEAFL